jgi:glycosyltransferase involved in cell wall biosynthesis
VAVSRYLARSIEQVFSVAPGHVTAALNGVDSTRFRPRSDGAPRAGAPTIGFLGRVAVEKGVDLLLEAAQLLRGRGHDFRVQIAGDTNWGRSEPGPYRSRVRDLAQQLSSTGVEVMMTGHLDRLQVPEALRATDIHVVPSRWDEPCGLTTLEGLATGLPVVGSATGGTPELLARCGLLFARDDANGLADQLERLVIDVGLRSELSLRSRERAEELSWTTTWRALSQTGSGESSRTEDVTGHA